MHLFKNPLSLHRSTGRAFTRGFDRTTPDAPLPETSDLCSLFHSHAFNCLRAFSLSPSRLRSHRAATKGNVNRIDFCSGQVRVALMIPSRAGKTGSSRHSTVSFLSLLH
ncbi:IS21 family transposase [Sesbania bispinosa]|nr:IS21 family transposase [Sesbania bispinosa]